MAELKENMAYFRRYFAQCMPTERGSAAIGEIFEGTLYKYHNLHVTYNKAKMIDLEAHTTLLTSTFLSDYNSMVQLTPLSEEYEEKTNIA